MPETERKWTQCEHCNRVLWVGDECDCPASQKPKTAKPKDATPETATSAD